MADDDKNELIDPKTLGETIKEKVKDLFLGAIPDEKWDRLIEGEIKAFFHEPVAHTVTEVKVPDRDYPGIYGDRTARATRLEAKVTAFRAEVFVALQPLVQARLKEALADEKFANGLVYGLADGTDKTKEEMSDFFKNMLSDIAPDLVKALFAGIFQQAAQNTAQAIHSAANGGAI